MKSVKFASQLDAKVLRDLRHFADQNDRSISSILSEAIAEYLSKAQVRPAFHSVMENVLNENEVLLKRLAK